MTKADDIQRLVERIERASGPDRELDCRVWCAVGGNSVDHFEVACAVVPDLNQWMAPRYTDSIDAAMTLVPEGWCFTVASYWAEGEDKPPFFADCADLPAIKADKFDTPVLEAWAATPALALCAASLRARITERTDDE